MKTSSLVRNSPPSPVVMFLLSCKLKQPISPHEPSILPSMLPPIAWAESSTTMRFAARATSMMAGTLLAVPRMWTGITTVVLGVILRSRSRGSML